MGLDCQEEEIRPINLNRYGIGKSPEFVTGSHDKMAVVSK